MTQEEEFSDEFLNAFVDGQLTLEEKNQVYAAINQDGELYKRVCELRQLRELVQISYENPPDAPEVPASGGHSSHWWRTGIAAGITLVVGAFLGWGLQGTNHGSSGPIAAVSEGKGAAIVPVAISDTSRRLNPAPVGENGIGVKVLFHINSGDLAKIKEGLIEIENLLSHYRKTNTFAQVEVIANGEALILYRADVSPFPDEIKRLQAKYKNLRFVACQNSIDRLKRERGIIARLLPGVVVIDSGVAQIMRRQQQGWAYIQV